MKKLFLLTAAFASMLFASCQKNELEPQANETTVSYTVELPSVQTKAGTKAIGDGLNVDQLIYEVWKTESADDTNLPNSTAIRLYQDETAMVINDDGVRSSVISLNLVQDQTYTILFWAQVEGKNHYNTAELTNVHYNNANGTYSSNDESLAAFYAVDCITDEDLKAKSRKVTLKRPFAQLNLGTKNTATDYTVTMNTSEVSFENVPTAFNVAQKKAYNDENSVIKFNFIHGNVPSKADGSVQNIKINDQTYEWAAMNYVFAKEGGQTAKIKYSIAATLTSSIDKNGDEFATSDVTIHNVIDNVPLMENYRTNVVGNLLTSTIQYDVVVDKSWADEPGDGTEVEVWDGKYIQKPYYDESTKTYYVSLASELAWISAAANGTIQDPEQNVKSAGYFEKENFAGKTIVLKENIDLNYAEWTPIGINTVVRTDGDVFEGTFDGNGKTISNLVVSTEGNASAGLFASSFGVIKNLTVDNAKIEGHYKAAVIVADGMCAKVENCTVKNSTVTSTPFEEDNANHVGAIVGYLSAEKTAYVKNCTIEGVTISGYRDVAGVVGTTNKAAVVSGNKIMNSTVYADQKPEYKEVKAANVGAIVGRINTTNAVIEDNGYDNVDVYVKVSTAENLEYQIDNASDDIKVVLCDDIKGDIMIHEKAGKDVIINGNDKKYDGTIKIHNGSSYNDGTVTIENVNFETSTASLNFIMPNDFDVVNGVTRRYSQNVTVSNCTFIATGEAENTAVGIQAKSSKNLQVINCTARNMHSLIQAQSCGENVEVKNCTVTGKNGVAFKQVKSTLVEGCTIEADEYGIRYDGNIDNYGIIVRGNDVTAKQPFIVRKMTGANNTISLEGENTFNTEETFQIVITKGSDDEEYVYPTGTYTLTGHDGFNVYPIDSKEAFAAAVNNSALAEVNVDGKIESVGTGFDIKRDVVLNFYNNELNAGSDANSKWYAIEANGDYNVVINDANFTRAGVYAANGVDVVFTNGVIKHNPERTSRYIFCSQSGATITVLDGTFTNDRANNSYFWADNSTIYIKGGIFDGASSKNKVELSNGGQVIISGGTFNFDPTPWLEAGYVAEKNGNGSTWTVRAANLVTTASDLSNALANANDGDIIVLAPGTYQGTFTPSANNITLKSVSADNKAIIAGRINVKTNTISFENVDFKVTDESKVLWSTGGSIMQSKPSIVMVESNDGVVSFNNCDFELSTQAFAMTASSRAKSVFTNCNFNGNFNYAIYARANIEVSNCTYTTSVTNVLVGVCLNALENGKVEFKNNTLENGSAINLAGAVVFCSTNNENGKWTGPVEFNVRDNTGFAYSFERMGDFVVDKNEHSFVDGSDEFTF